MPSTPPYVDPGDDTSPDGPMSLPTSLTRVPPDVGSVVTDPPDTTDTDDTDGRRYDSSDPPLDVHSLHCDPTDTLTLCSDPKPGDDKHTS